MRLQSPSDAMLITALELGPAALLRLAGPPPAHHRSGSCHRRYPELLVCLAASRQAVQALGSPASQRLPSGP